MRKISIIAACNRCRSYDDAWIRCTTANRDIETEDVDKVPIPGWCPLPDEEEFTALRARAEKAEAEVKQLREELSHSILEATAQLVNAKADVLVRAEKAEELLRQFADYRVQPYAGARYECIFCGALEGHRDGCISLEAKALAGKGE